MTETDAGSTRVAVIGLGLIGGSLAAGLRAAGGWRVAGYDRDAGVREVALSQRLVDETHDTFDEAVAGAELIVLATPVSVILADIQRLATLAADGATVLDVGSTKRAVDEAMKALPERLRAVGGHPMAGRRTAGVGTASAALFRGRKFVLVANARSDEHALRLARRVVNELGADAVEMEAAAHDRAVAMISHVPHFLSVGLLGATRRMDEDHLWQLAAGGFRSATSMAADNPDMWLDIGVSNGDCIATSLRSVAAELEALAGLLESGDRVALREALGDAKKLLTQRLG